MPKTFTFSGSSFAVDSRAPDGDGFVIREGKVTRVDIAGKVSGRGRIVWEGVAP